MCIILILPQQVLFLSVPYYADDAGTKQIFKNVAATKERPFLVIWSDDEIVLSVNIPFIASAPLVPLVSFAPLVSFVPLIPLVPPILSKQRRLNGVYHRFWCFYTVFAGSILPRICGNVNTMLIYWSCCFAFAEE